MTLNAETVLEHGTQGADEELLAAIDLGSNSFHLAIARLDHGEVRKVVALSEKVQLGAGLDADNQLSEAAQRRGLECLSRFAARLGSIPPERLRVVATNALRQAENASVFIEQASRILPKPIEIIAGREEARLIYLGVSHTMPSGGKRLVIDIGGGSTEFIIGDGFEPILTESLQMGCVAFTQSFFSDGQLSSKAFNKALAAARREMQGILGSYTRQGWDGVVGSSGTIKATRQVLIELGLSNEKEEITRSGLEKLVEQVLRWRHVDDIELPGLKEDRKAVLPAGLAILLAIFQSMDLTALTYSDGALREGVLYDQLGRFRHEDVRDRSVSALMARYSVDVRQAERVTETAKQLREQVAARLLLDDEDADLLRRAASLHEIGLAISHGAYQRHGAYLLEHSDVPGFSQSDQMRLALVVGCHRRKLKMDGLANILKIGGQRLMALCLILRLAVALHQARSDQALPEVTLRAANAQEWRLTIDASAEDWFMLAGVLEIEQAYQSGWGVGLSVKWALD